MRQLKTNIEIKLSIIFLRRWRVISSPTILSVLSALSLETVCIIYEIAGPLVNRINHNILLATDGDTVPIKDDLPRLCHLRCLMISIRDLLFSSVQIDRRVLVNFIANFTIILILLTCSQWLVVNHLHTTKIGCYDL